MEKIEVLIQKPIYDKLQEMSDNLKISLEEICNLSLIDGYSLYWFSYKKELLDIDLSDMPGDDLANQFHERYELLQEIETIESEFESKYPFGHFTEIYERYKKFLDFINAFKDSKTIEKQEGKKTKEVPSHIPKAQKVSKDKRKQKKIKQAVETPVKILPKRRVPLLLFSFLTTFLIFWLIRDYLNPIEMIRYTPNYFIGYVFLAVFTLFFMGGVYLGFLYSIRKIKEKAPYRAEARVYKEYRKEFKKLSPKNSYETKTDRLIALGEFLEAKKRALPFTRH